MPATLKFCKHTSVGYPHGEEYRAWIIPGVMFVTQWVLSSRDGSDNMTWYFAMTKNDKQNESVECKLEI